MADVPATFEVPCPCCGATLTVSAELRCVLRHTPAPDKQSVTDLNAAIAGLEAARAETERKFQASVAAEEGKKARLESQFNDLFDKAQKGELPDAGPRDIDLD